MSTLSEKFSELRDRRLIQIVLSYAAAGWIAVEAASQFVERGVLPDIAYSVILIWYVGGFMAAVIIGWYHGEKGAQKAPPLEIGMLVVLGLGMTVMSVTRVSGYLEQQEALAAAAESSMDLERIAVRYFDDLSDDGEYQYLADGLTEGLIDELNRVRTLDVVSRNGVMPYRGADIGVDSLARALRAGTVVDGAVEPVGEEFRITLRLLDGESGAQIRRATFTRPADELLEIRQQVSEEASRFLREWLGEEVELRRMEERRLQNVDAWALVQRAERARKQMDEAFGHDGQAVEEAYQRADDLLDRAETLEPDWSEPATRRAWLAFDRSQMAHEIPEMTRWAERGLAHAEGALERDPNDARAVEARGTLRYWSWLMELPASSLERDALFEQAREDLREAVDLDPTLASAYNTLGHLYSQYDVPQAIIAARTAYQEDAYLDVADSILWRLYSLSFDLRQLGQARRWCEEGSQRFPNNQRFAICQLRLMTTAATEPDVDRAWRLVARLDSLATGAEAEWQALNGRLLAGAVVGRAGLADSARSVLLRTRDQATHEVDPQQELLWREAYARTVIGDYDEAIDLLLRYKAANPSHEFDPGDDLGWWWNDLRDYSRFEELAPER